MSIGDDYSGLALTGFVIASAILNRLKGKEILTSEEIAELLDHSMLLLEQVGLDDSAKQRAHALIESTRKLYAQSIPPSQEP
jgi:hypothetical protein